jgi:hypothetical protein
VTENHAKMAYKYVENESLKEGNADILLGEMDGCMLPIVETSIPEEGLDNRKCREVRWQEARLCMSRHPKEVSPVFYATLSGDVDRAGNLLYRAALKAGFGVKTEVHCIGDGACWIVAQVKRVFGSNASYLIDFYHISEYLSDAAEHSWTSEKAEWLHRSQDLLKANKHEDLLVIIKRRMAVEAEEEESPVQKCYRHCK